MIEPSFPDALPTSIARQRVAGVYDSTADVEAVRHRLHEPASVMRARMYAVAPGDDAVRLRRGDEAGLANRRRVR
jgi:hypothetical protein